ncbi:MULTISPECIES: single-stranded-DNA-specific exonuclease RecJ [Pseudanabaena]|uniref:single-stranded-DNA-specific exonuclease RecJ n=1 Tax=Pseudanabaena TaxID=1152 RepID=UPI002479CE10|nr:MULTISPECIES: DHH family phosphoesterase [Pseudanabaena]MEA5487416.1 DHH family phosphoesterase [Pseudanabaena sp. CCNP1317]WGS73152.1 DHH family phosphoesterase [Pseudanabaena galeata CCNP1313]
MLLPQQRWQIFSPQPDLSAAIANSTGLSPIIAQVLLNRGIDTPEAAKVFLDPELEDLPDPKQEFPDLIASIDRIELAIKNGDRITICGDYDVDGMTSTALLIRTLRLLGGNVEYEIPSRMTEGYGINARIVQDCCDREVKLIITVDNGIAAYEAIALAESLNISVIVTDHHEVPEDPTKIPPATAILNPKYQVDPNSPYAAIAGVGVAYVLALELSDRFGKRAELENPLLELFTLGTIADLASLTGINRRLVKKGLRLLSQSKVIGIIALINETGIAKDKQTGLKPEAIGFGLGPRINAIGRIGNPQVIIDLLTCEEMGEAIALAQECEATNRQRQDLCKEIEQEAITYMSKLKSEGFDITQERVLVIVDREVKEALTPSPSPKGGEGSKTSTKRKKSSSKSSAPLSSLEDSSPLGDESSNLAPLSPTGRGAGGEGWHHGVIGIVASRLVERYGAPVFIGSYEDAHEENLESKHHGATVRFSVRGIPEFHVFHSLEYIANIRNKGGGHKAAGGFTLPAENMEKLRNGLREFADRENLLPSHIIPLINVDVLADLSEISMTMLQTCDRLQPCGLGNPDPVFYSQNVRVLSQQTRGRDKVKHLSLDLDTGNGKIKAIAWRWGEYCPVPDYVDIAYKLRANQWQDTTSVELEVVGIREATGTAMESSQNSPKHLQLQYKSAPVITKIPQWQKLSEAPRPLPRPLLLYGCDRPADKFQGDVDCDRPIRDRDYHAVVLWTLPPSFTHLQWLIATAKPDYIYLGSHIPSIPSIEQFRVQVQSLDLENIEKLNLLDISQQWWISPSAIVSALRELGYICDFPPTLPLEGELLRMQKWYAIAIAKLAALITQS